MFVEFEHLHTDDSLKSHIPTDETKKDCPKNSALQSENTFLDTTMAFALSIITAPHHESAHIPTEQHDEKEHSSNERRLFSISENTAPPFEAKTMQFMNKHFLKSTNESLCIMFTHLDLLIYTGVIIVLRNKVFLMCTSPNPYQFMRMELIVNLNKHDDRLKLVVQNSGDIDCSCDASLWRLIFIIKDSSRG